MASRLLKAGYISRVPSSSDARAWELKVTKSGRRALTQTRAPFDRLNEILDTCIDADDMETLASGLSEVLKALRREV